MKNLTGNLLLLFSSVAIAFAVGEIVSRVFSPISPGPSILDLDGHKQKISYIEPGKTFRITTPDYDAQTSISPDGYRAPLVTGNPESIFIGDSFTYAQGVTDQQAFPAIYCNAKGRQCVNLAVPGASTLYEIDRLEHFLRIKNWSPNFVNLFFFSGNDFLDNLAASAKRRKGIAYAPDEINLESDKQKELQQKIVETGLHYSNLLRVAYYKVLPIFRDDPQQSEDALNDALKITRTELLRLNALSEKYAFALRIFIIFPQQEIEQGIYKKLTEKMQSISPVPVIPLGELFKDNAAQYYFPTDGHFNVAGNRKLADFLLQKYY